MRGSAAGRWDNACWPRDSVAEASGGGKGRSATGAAQNRASFCASVQSQTMLDNGGEMEVKVAKWGG